MELKNNWFEKIQSSPFIFWNDGLKGSYLDNSFPQVIWSAIFGHWVGQVFERKTNLIYGKGLIIGYDGDYSKESQSKALENKDVKNFIRSNAFNTTFRSWLYNSYVYGECFAELLLNKNNKIAALSCMASGYYRKGLNNDYVYVYDFYHYFRFGLIGAMYPPANEMKKMPMIDMDNSYYIADILSDNQHNTVIRTGIGDGLMGYSRPASQGLFTHNNEWLNVSKSLPESWINFRKNYASPGATLEFPIEYMRSKYSEWETFNTDMQKELLTKESEDFDNKMAGHKQAGKTLRYVSYPTNDGTKERIKPTFSYILANMEKFVDGLVSQRRESASEILAILGVPMALQDVVPKGDSIVPSSAESITAVYENFVRENRFLVETFFQIFEIIKQYNEWDDKISIDVEYQWQFDKTQQTNGNQI